MARPLSEEEIELINEMDDENILLTVPDGYEVLLDEKRGIIVRPSSKNGSERVHIAG